MRYTAVWLGLVAFAGCGVDDQLAETEQPIIGGIGTSEYPAVGLVNTGCTATVIHPHLVLTASHCCYPDPGVCRTFELGEHTFDVQQAVLHPSYQVLEGGGITPSYDIAVLILEQPVKHLEPMRLAALAPQVGRAIEVVGFGCTELGGPGFGTKRLGHNTIEFYGQDVNGEDQERFADVFGWTSTGTYEDANICPGDSGGPTVWIEDGTPVIAGIHTLVGDGFGYSTTVSARLDFVESYYPECTLGDIEPCDPCTARVCGPDLTMGDMCSPIVPAPVGCGESAGPDAGPTDDGTESSGGCSTHRPPGTLAGLVVLMALGWLRRRRV